MRLLTALALLTALSGRADEHPFRFSPVDEKILDEANEIDRQFEKKGLVLHNREAEAYLSDIGTRLLGGTAPPERVQYFFRILRDPMINAFALPNGSVYVNTGIIAAMQDETDLAVVLAHEIAHVANRHSYIQNRSLRKKAVAMGIIGLAANGAGFLPVGAAFGHSISFASQFSQLVIIASVYGYSRALEREADAAGYGLLVRAGYDGAGMARALAALDERLEFEPVESFWRTHPKIEERIADARKRTPPEGAGGPRSTSESEYLRALADVVRSNVVLDVGSRRTRTAVARAQRLVNWSPDAANSALLADAYHSLGAKTAKPAELEMSRQGKKAARNQMLKLTAQEEQQLLLASTTGREMLGANREMAEKLYKDAIAKAPLLPDPHRGLGMLYQDQSRYSEAVREYRAYLELSRANVIDRLRIQKRLEACTRAAENGSEKR